MSKQTTKLPRLSVNKLCEFMTAKSGRQRQILKDQKYPSDFKGMFYKEASEAISSALATNLEDISAIENQIKILEQMSPSKVGSQRRIAANIDALETFLTMLDAVEFGKATPSLGAKYAEKLTIHGVEISVRPEILLTEQSKNKILVGAVKLHFPRTFSLNKDSAGNVSALLQRWSEINLDLVGNVSGPLCTVIDVGSKQVYPGVKATAARIKDVEAACQNIAALWPSI